MFTSELAPVRRTSLRALAALGALALASSGCIEHSLRSGQQPFDYAALPVTVGSEPEPGAIWRGNQPAGSFLFFDQKARAVGDLVTVRIAEDIRAEGRAQTGTGRKGELSNTLASDVGITDFITTGIKTLFGMFGIGGPGIGGSDDAEVNILTASNENKFEGEGSTSREGQFQGVITCRVLAVLPGGVFHVRGRRSITINHEEQLLTLEGLVRQEDISIGNTVSSTALAEARLTIDGLGVIDDKQRPGWASRIFDWAYPF
jgi:flagellar L-ring protein precursor FlgH